MCEIQPQERLVGSGGDIPPPEEEAARRKREATAMPVVSCPPPQVFQTVPGNAHATMQIMPCCVCVLARQRQACSAHQFTQHSENILNMF